MFSLLDIHHLKTAQEKKREEFFLLYVYISARLEWKLEFENFTLKHFIQI
jgi:hypothetical protein